VNTTPIKTGQNIAQKIGAQNTECGIISSVEYAQDAANRLANTNTEIIWRSVINAGKYFFQSLLLHTNRFVTGTLIFGQRGILYKAPFFYSGKKLGSLCTPNDFYPMNL
jgi:hypothetical protein